MNTNQVDAPKNIEGIENYSDVFNAIMDLTKTDFHNENFDV